ncbi:MAG: biopolymer transporter ExbD [Arcobacteraceae bacterium]|nr:biopolymer transporter ExbD [Arcobacteraceae bacterium]
MRHKKREILTPDLTPLIDIVFILLIFFIVSSVFKKEELALNLSLPSSNAKELEVEIKQLNIELSPTSLAYLGKQIDFTQLDIQLANITKKDMPVILRIDKEVKYDRLIKVLDALQKYSLNNLALVTQEN